jgi:hypothetical protein
MYQIDLEQWMLGGELQILGVMLENFGRNQMLIT